MDINDLNIFLTITELGTYMDAAKATHSSLAKVYRAVARIEDELNVQVFNHDKNKVSLNTYGEILREKAREIVNIQKSLQENLDYYRFRDSGTIKIESCDPGPAWFMSHALFNQDPSIDNETNTYKDIKIGLSMLKDELTDVLITDVPVDAQGYTCQFMARDAIVLSVHQEDERFRETRQISLMDGRIDRVYTFNIDCVFQEKAKKVFDRVSKYKDIIYENNYFVFQAISERKKSIITSTRLVSEFRKDGDDLKILPLTDLGLDINYYLVYKNANKKRLEKILELANIWAEKYK